MARGGIYRGEKDSRQEIMLDIAAEVGEPADDRIGETIDYRALLREAQKLSGEGHFESIETFICELGRRIVSHVRFHAVDLELCKPGALPPALGSVRSRVNKPSPYTDDWTVYAGGQDKCHD